MTDPAISSHMYLLFKKRRDISGVADAGSSIKYSACLGNIFIMNPLHFVLVKKVTFLLLDIQKC